MAEADDYAPEEEDDVPASEAKSSRLWLGRIDQAQKAFDDYQTRADAIDKLYADLSQLATDSRDRQFQMFWANIEVLKPSVYSRPPVPVVTPRFKDRRPVPRTASEFLERAVVVAFETGDIDATMKLLRDDLVIQARGAAWVRYETKAESKGATEKVCIEHLDRKDFLHEPARKWQEVGWVARRAWLTKKEMRKRFHEHSGDAYLEAEYIVRKDDKDNGAADRQQKAGVWEIWSRDDNRVIWVTPGCKKRLDDGEPHLKLEGFYPCPQPAYSTTQRRSLIPIPDMLFYKDQLEEINELTGRISALTSAVKVRGFYPAGAGGDVGDAIETALKTLDDRQVMIGVSNWSAFGGGSAKDAIVWLPIDMIVTTIAALIEQRRQIIDDVYQITGLSDIMRGNTDPKETLGAQQLKSQYGSIRIRDRQGELVRVARDLTRITAEIMAENFSQQTLIDMTQLEFPKDAEIKRQVAELKKRGEQIVRQAEQQMEQARSNPQIAAMAQQNPEQAQQMLQQLEGQVNEQLEALGQQANELTEQVTIEQVMSLLHEQKLRPFVLDIETDSTIQPDEDAEKQRRSEFLTALGAAMTQLAPMVAERPETAVFAGEILKFAVAPFRAGREMDAAIDEFVEQLKAQVGQPKPDPAGEAMKMEAEAKAQAMQADAAAKKTDSDAKALQAQTDAQNAELERRIKEQKEADAARMRMIEMSGKEREAARRIEIMDADRADRAQKHAQDMEIGGMQIAKIEREMQIKDQAAVIDAASKEHASDLDERAFEHKSALAEQQQANRTKSSS